MNIKELLLGFVNGLANVYVILIVIQALASWFREDMLYKFKAFFGFVYSVVVPFLALIKRIFPTSFRGADFSPVLAALLVELARIGIIKLIIAFIK